MDVAMRRPNGRVPKVGAFRRQHGAVTERAGVAYMDVGKGREQERKLEGIKTNPAAAQ